MIEWILIVFVIMLMAGLGSLSVLDVRNIIHHPAFLLHSLIIIKGSKSSNQSFDNSAKYSSEYSFGLVLILSGVIIVIMDKIIKVIFFTSAIYHFSVRVVRVSQNELF